MFTVLSPHIYLQMTSISSGVSKPDVISVISLNDFPLINACNSFLNPRKTDPAVAGFRFGGTKNCFGSREIRGSESCSSGKTSSQLSYSSNAG